MASYNVTRFTRQVLKRYRKEPPSLVLHLYPTHFRFEHQHGNFNYDSPMKCFLEAIREQKLPTDLLDVLDQSAVRYYEGCLIVEVHDHRSLPPAASATPAAPVDAPGPSLVRFPRQQLSFAAGQTRDQPNLTKAEVYRIVLGPGPATLWTELGIMNESMMEQKELEAGGEHAGWTEEEAVAIEARILTSTMPPLCLSPSLQTTRIANTMLRATTLRPPKRKRFSCTGSEDAEEAGGESERLDREERDRLMKMGDEGIARGRANPFARLAFIQSYRERTANPAAANPSVTSIRLVSKHAQGRPGSIPPTASPNDTKRSKKKKLPATESDGTPGPSIKKSRNSNAGSPEPLDTGIDLTERERANAERKRVAGQKKRAEAAKLRNENRRKDTAAAAPAARYSWAT